MASREPARRGRSACSTPHTDQSHPELSMNRYAAPLGFTIAAMWVVVVFILVSGTR